MAHLQSLLWISRVAAITLPCLSFGPSYVRFVLMGDWKFAGIQPSALGSTSQDDHIVLGAHVALTLVWMLSSVHQIFVLNGFMLRSLYVHRVVGRVAFVAHLVGLCFIATSPQMNSCWPITTPFGHVSRDTINTLYVVLFFIMHSTQGVVSAWKRSRVRDGGGTWKNQLKNEHVQFMLQGLLASSNAAMMRVCIIPSVLILSRFWSRTAWPADGDWVSVGEWLLAKHIGYGMQAILLVLPVFVPSWSPYASEVWKLMSGRLFGLLKVRAILFCGVLLWSSSVVVERIYSSFQYARVIGFDGGVSPEAACMIHKGEETVPHKSLFVLIPTTFIGILAIVLQAPQHGHAD